MTQMQDENILVWLPSPMGDAILCTPALRAIRERFKNSRIFFLAKPVVREVLSPGKFNDEWLILQSKNPFVIAKILTPYHFSQAILFKNSFASAAAVYLARIPSRIGYVRESRTMLLTEKLHPPKSGLTGFKPVSMIDYYLAIASWLGADTANRRLELSVDPKETQSVREILAQHGKLLGPLVIIVPGGAFGPSKCWPSERFAKTADWIIDKYKANVAISVSPSPAEKQIANQICNMSQHKLINLAQTSLTLGRLKALFAEADLVICNDTGPRHIAIALQRKIITLFGPNDPAWTQTGYENEIQIVGNAPCAPCSSPICKKNQHLCMEDIACETVCEAAEKMLSANSATALSKPTQQFIEIAPALFVDTDFTQAIEELNLTSFDAIFEFNAGKNLVKNNLAPFRKRIQLQINQPQTTAFLKLYNSPPAGTQIKHWLTHRRHESFAFSEFAPVNRLAEIGINTPKIIAYGWQWNGLFEKRSFIITEKIANAESIERKLPRYVTEPATTDSLRLKRSFIRKLSAFIRKFHQTGYRHRDLYFAHIFYDDNEQFFLIDLARVFKPALSPERFRIKDVTQLYYSAPGRYFSKSDRLRFYFGYAGIKKLTPQDKEFIRKIINKTKRMARHDVKHARSVPFEN